MQGYKVVAGLDEAGRGPLAGPVVGAACIILPHVHFEGLHDSKLLKEEQREALYEEITNHPDVQWAVRVVSHTTIDEINILQAAMMAMREAAQELSSRGPLDYLLVDGNYRPPGILDVPLETVVKGDSKCYCIAAASIIAKVTRDRIMMAYDKQYPQYGFCQHKGYHVPQHVAAIRSYGPCDIHRRSFEPIKSITGWTREKGSQAVVPQG